MVHPSIVGNQPTQSTNPHKFNKERQHARHADVFVTPQPKEKQ